MIDLSGFYRIILNSLDDIIRIVIIVVITTIIVKIQRILSDRAFKRLSKLNKTDPTQFHFFKHLLSAVIYMVGIGIAVYDIPALRTFSVSALASAGVLAVVLGFAAQQAFSNLISGLFIIIFRPFNVEDRIKVNPGKEEISGVVEEISLRHTVIRTFENKRVIIPNSIMGNSTIENSNYKDTKICRFVEFPISYDSDMDKAMRIMTEEAQKHPLHIDNRTAEEKKADEPVVQVRVLGFGESSVNLRAWVWTQNPADAFVLGTDLNRTIKKRFDKAGIEIPYPHRTIIEKNVRRK